MRALVEQVCEALRQCGWAVERATHPRRPTEDFLVRYHWVPAEVMEVYCSITSAVAPGDGTWLVTAADQLGESDAAFRWDEFERMSLEAVAGDESETRRVRHFWDAHLCVAMSVSGGYEHYSLEKGTFRIVRGREPEFEEVLPLADNYASMVARFAAPITSS